MPKMSKNTITTTQPVIVDTQVQRGRGRPMSAKTLESIRAAGLTVAEYKAAMAQKKEEMNVRRAAGEVKRGRKPGSKNTQTVVQPKRQKAATYTTVKAQTVKAQEARGIQPIVTKIVRPAETYIVKNSKGKDETITFAAESAYSVFFPCCNRTDVSSIKDSIITCTCGTVAKI